MAVKKSSKETSPNKAGKPKKATARKSDPTEEDIRIKAGEIYLDRIARGLDGTAENDWRQAEKLLRTAK